MKHRLIPVAAAFTVAALNSLYADGPAIELHVGDDLQQARVEARDPDTGRWLAIASGYRDHADSGWLRIALPEGYGEADLRVLGSREESPFAGRIESARTAGETHVDYPQVPGNGWLDYGAEGGRDDKGGEPVIEEADIWAWNGSTLYFYNQYRGLQVIDMADPLEPAWLDYYRYPARGEDLYALADGTAILIGTGSYWNGEKVALQFLEFDGTELTHLDTVELEAGYYMDSRRYGDFLYIMTREWVHEINPDGNERRKPLIRLYTVALDETAEERVVDVQTYESSGWLDAVLTAQPGGILLSLNRWHNRSSNWRYRWHSELHVLVPGEDGIPELVGVAPLSGVVHDKFKMNYADGLLTAVSQQADWTTGTFSRATKLENFRLVEDGFRKVGSLDLAPGETLFATRFHGDTVYVVTFLLVDPLFAIDNSDPSRPKVAGELKVPGWSNYIEWVDDQLFAIGIEDRRLTVSIFDVADPANMSLKDRVFLNEDSWAHSEAQYDDQAISFFPEKKILMVPFTTWSWESQEQIQAMQLISWDEEGLSVRGAIQHLDTPRRGTLTDDTVVTISGREVVTTDITDPDLPVEGGSATLAWSANRLHMVGDHLVQLETVGSSYGWYWRSPYDPNAMDEPVLYVTSVKEPNIPAVEIPLEPGKLIGSALYANYDRLILLQDISEYPEGQSYWEIPDSQSLAVRLYNLSDPLSPAFMNEDLLENIDYLGNSFKAHPIGESLVWASDAVMGYYPFLDRGFIDIWPGPIASQNRLSFLVTHYGPMIDSVVFGPWKAFMPETETGNASPWFWQEPRLVATRTEYKEVELPEGRNDYERRTGLVAVDFSIPGEPMQLPEVPVPANLSTVRALPDGINHYLYFEPRYNVLEVWGWDLAAAFPLFKQEIPDISAEETNTYSYSLAWMPPFHLRQRYHYNNGQSNNFLDVWLHRAEANAFERIEVFDFESEWLGQNAVIGPYYLQATNNRIHFFHGDPYRAVFEKLDTATIDLPNVYSLSLDESLIMANQALIPAGLYGVETVPYAGFFEPLEARGHRRIEDTLPNNWEELPTEEWQLVDRAATEGAGAISRFQWLYRPDSMRELDPQAEDTGDFWRHSPWFGWYAHRVEAPAWIDHLEHGTLYTYVGENPAMTGIHLYDARVGMLWTHADVYPWLYRYDDGDWLYYLAGSGADGRRWFYAPGAGWFSRE